MSGVQFVEARRAVGGEAVNALQLTRIEWEQLQRSYQVGDLLMPCCPSPAIPKISPNGHQFFAHASGACSSSEESQWHQAAKLLVRANLEQLGCIASLEEPGSGDSGRWQADVWGERGSFKLAVEIQRSYQTLRDYRQRQERYRAAGIQSLWLLSGERYSTLCRSMGKERLRSEFGGKLPPCGHFSPCLADIPVARLELDPDPAVSGAGFFSATVPELLEAVLTARFRWIDGLWCIDNLENMKLAAQRSREANAIAKAERGR